MGVKHIDSNLGTGEPVVHCVSYLTKQKSADCTNAWVIKTKSLPPQVIVGHVKVFQCEQEVIKGLCRYFDQLVVVDDQVLQIDQTCQVPGAKHCQAIT